MIYIKDMDMPVDCLACRISCKHESYLVTGRPKDCPLEEAKDGDLISRADAIEATWKEPAYTDAINVLTEVRERITALPSAEAVQGDGRNNIKRYPNCQMRTSLGNCDAIGGFCTSINAPICDAFHKLSEAVQGWIPLVHDEMTTDFPHEHDGEWVIVTDGKNISVERIKKDAYDHFYPNGRWFELDDAIAWMPLPTQYKGGEDK